MTITEDIAKKVGYDESVEIKGVTYMFDPYKDEYSIDGSVSYFKALKLGAEVDADDADDILFYTDWYIGFPKYDWIPDRDDEDYWEWAHNADSEWDSIYDPDKPFLYEE